MQAKFSAASMSRILAAMEDKVMIKFTAEDGDVSIKHAFMETYCRCKSCGHKWSIAGNASINDCPACKQAGKKDVAMGYVPDWWDK